MAMMSANQGQLPDRNSSAWARWISRHVDQAALGQQRVVVRFEFPRPRLRRYWLVLNPDEVSVCLDDPGFDTDILVSADIAALYGLWSPQAGPMVFATRSLRRSHPVGHQVWPWHRAGCRSDSPTACVVEDCRR